MSGAAPRAAPAALLAELEAHKLQDDGHFAELSRSIGQLQTAVEGGFATLDARMTAIERRAEGMDEEVLSLQLAAARAEGRAQGLTEAKAPNPWALALAPVIVGALAGGVLAAVEQLHR